MTLTNKPKAGEPIVKLVQGPLGERIYIATDLFWKYLDELDSEVTVIDDVPLFQQSNFYDTDDSISALQNSQVTQSSASLEDRLEALENSLKPSLDFGLTDKIEALESQVALLLSLIQNINPGFEVVEIESSTTAFTTTGNQIIVCNNTSHLDITLNLTPDSPEQIIVIRRDSTVDLIGTINGGTPTSIPSVHDILEVYYTEAAGEWSA